MDHADYHKGTELLSSPALLPQFPDKVLSCLLKAGMSSQEAAYALGGTSREDIRALVLGYWYSKGMGLGRKRSEHEGSRAEMQMFDFLCQGGVRDGYRFYKRWFDDAGAHEEDREDAEKERKEWFTRLVRHALDPSAFTADHDIDINMSRASSQHTAAATTRRTARSARTHTRSTSKQITTPSSTSHTATNNTNANSPSIAGLSLIDLPLSPQETHWLDEYLSPEGEGRDLPFAADTLILRGVVTGRAGVMPTDLNAAGSAKVVDGLSWGVVTPGLSRWAAGNDESVRRAVEGYRWGD